MNNYNKTELQLDGLDIEGLYLEDVFSVWEQYDKNANRYFTVFMINNSRITVPGTDANLAILQKASHGITEFVVTQGVIHEKLMSCHPSGAESNSITAEVIQ